MEKDTKKEKVSDDVIARLQNQKIESNGIVDPIDNVDRRCGRLFSKLGKLIVENF